MCIRDSSRTPSGRDGHIDLHLPGPEQRGSGRKRNDLLPVSYTHLPIELSATSRTTNLTNTPVVNRKNDTAITIKKVDSANQPVAGAVFTVTFPDKTTANFTTGTDGTVQVLSLIHI